MSHGLHVLVVDGEATMRDLIASMLEAAGLAVEIAPESEKADLALSSGEFDVVVSAADPPHDSLLARGRLNRPTPPVISVGEEPIHGLLLLAAIHEVADQE
jgi:DNA-binding response OmpR family regulator